ncbi:hypothetical protein Gasu2_69000 [Galdieria sulphuraria]|nr:hypothetical protein Gasu2_69000 [Galdieria sulphuraria]
MQFPLLLFQMTLLMKTPALTLQPTSDDSLGALEKLRLNQGKQKLFAVLSIFIAFLDKDETLSFPFGKGILFEDDTEPTDE